MSHNMIRRILEGSRKVEDVVAEGRTKRGERDGTGPFKGSFRGRKGMKGRRRAAGMKCPKEDSELQQYATEPPGAMGEDDESLTVEEVEQLCSECAASMKERGVTGVKLGPALESGIFEIAEEGDVDGVVFEREGKDGWPKKLKTGRFSAYCKREGFAGPSVSCAKKAVESDDESVRGMASFYMNTVQPGDKTASAVGGEKECAPGPDDEE